MGEGKLLLCTDMDRTVIPNGHQPEHPAARKIFRKFCAQPEVTLVYVTGRHQELVREAIGEYGLPKPDFVITDVGSKIYQVAGEEWESLVRWEEKIDRDWKGRGHDEIMQLFEDIPELELQEESKQNTHKLSYYLSLKADADAVIAAMEKRLRKEGVLASLIWSIDEQKNIGLLDVMPLGATKLSSIVFLQQELGYRREEVIFAGDSGNDLQVLESEIPSVLVANASEEVREKAGQLAAKEGNSGALYFASGQHLEMNGNYSAGVLEGVWYFIPSFRSKLEKLCRANMR